MRALIASRSVAGLMRAALGFGVVVGGASLAWAADHVLDGTASIPVRAAIASQGGAASAVIQLLDIPAPPPVPAAAGFEALAPAADGAAGAARQSPKKSVPDNAMAASEPPAKKPAPAEPQQAPVAAADHVLSPNDLSAALAAFVRSEPAGARTYRYASLTARQERASIAAFYALRDNAAIWIADGVWTAEAHAVIDLLARAGDDGLDLTGFSVPAVPGSGGANLANAELALSEAVAAYGFEASGGRVDPAKIAETIGDRPAFADALRVLTDVAIAADPVAVLAAYNPPHAGYAALRQKLIDLRHAGERTADIPIGPGRVLRIGMRDPRVSLIRSRFKLGAAADADADGDALVYDTVVASAVAGFQRANGLPPSGILTARTVSALSGVKSPGLEAEVVANMERWRWLPRDLGAAYVEVNLPAFRLKVVEDGAVVHTSRVIVGKTSTPTPLFSNAIQYLTINPSWYVPQSIIKKEMMPHLASDPDYLTRHGYEVTYRGGTLSVRQPPGPRNALGHIVFWFPNPYDVYLHDTSSRGLFGNSFRSESHGCVRVDMPFKLAEIVLRGQNGLTEDKLEAMVGTSERWLTLPSRFPIHIVYFTATVGDDGRLQVNEDIYGYSQRVKEALKPVG